MTDQKQPLNLQISPLLFFEVLLRRAVKEMEGANHTVERTAFQRIPVFDVNETMALLEEEEIICYLVQLLASFVRSESQTLTDIDIDRLTKLGEEAVGNEERSFFVQKRIADVCLFVLGVFPEHLMLDYVYLFTKKEPPLIGEIRRNTGDYEALGQRFYALAAEHRLARIQGLRTVLQLLAENFYLAKKPLNFMSERYLAIHQLKTPS